MNIGIVGSEAAKFTPKTEGLAKTAIGQIFAAQSPIAPTIVSGHCHLGGIDIWAENMADSLQLPKLIFPPAAYNWEAGYKPRNIAIAMNSDIVYVITVKELPEGYTGMRFKGCYHCDKPSRKYIQVANTGCVTVAEADHIKSGGCWTAWYAVERLGKQARWIII